ncbi:uncharacterized protein LOC143178992 [Calliopsis andreniformis]|uniref:uncharacterized protein LOC143178992 n=1 Tax=Calliopsis andreniformis TaxID=337506 RepID=UPI003FCC82FD
MEISHCTRKSGQKPQLSIFRDENLLYLQPATRRLMICNRPYKKPTLKIESDTTYSISYLKSDCPKYRLNYKIHEKILNDKVTGKYDFDTVYKLSYQASERKQRRPFLPRPNLFISGFHDMTTIHMLSYKNSGYSKATPFEPYRGKVNYRVPMASETVMKDSYQSFGPIEVKRSIKRQFWQTKFKMDYHTTSQLSYQHLGVSKRSRHVPKRPIISAPVEKDTVFSTSYTAPGRFVNKNIVIYE